MATFKDLLSQTKKQIKEVSTDDLKKRLAGATKPVLPVLIDVREADEVEAGILPGALAIPRGFLELRIEDKVPDRAQRRSSSTAPAAPARPWPRRRLSELGYTHVESLRRRLQPLDAIRGCPPRSRSSLNAEQKERYRRHLIIPEVGEVGQQKLLDAKVLLMGAGGLGSPAALYLAAAGWARSASSTWTSSTSPTCSGRSSTPSDSLGKPKTESAAKPGSTRSIPT